MCDSVKESLRVSQSNKVNEFMLNKSLLINKTFKGDKNLVLKKYMDYQFDRVNRNEITITKLAKTLNCSRTWLSILYNRYKKGESLAKPKGHRKSCFSKNQKNQLKSLYKELSYEYKGIVYTPSMQVLKDIALEKIDSFPDVHIESIRNILNEGKVYLKHIKIKKYRKRFEADAVGQLIQGDVSIHNWIPENKLKFCLILFIDDKSRYVLYARFVNSDNLENHITALKEMIKIFGIPVAIYYDNDSKYNYIRNNGLYFDLDKEKPDSVIPSALREIGITLINSKPYQPQGKGKVERKFGVFQNQLPFYLKLNNVTNIDEANMVLEKYIIKHNSTVNRSTKDTPENIFKKGPDIFKDISKKDLEDIENAFTIRATRKVSNVNEISYSNKIYNVPKYKNISLATFKIEVRENPNKWIKLYYKNNFLIKYNLKEK